MFVRLAMPEDVEAIVDMGRINCELTCQPDVYSPLVARQRLEQYFTDANPTFFVCEHEREPIGFLMSRICEFDHRDGIYTTQSVLFVLPEHRGTRAAVQLMKELIRWSKQIGAAAIDGGNDNGFQSERTASFLKHFGFEQAGYAMRLRLDDVEEGRK